MTLLDPDHVRTSAGPRDIDRPGEPTPTSAAPSAGVTGPAAPDPPQAGGTASGPPEDASLRVLLGRINRFLYNKRTGLGLMLAMGAATLLGTVFAQVPDDVRADPALYAQWLESVRPTYGGWTTILGRVGIFSVFDSWWFAAITVLLAASIVACTLHRLPMLDQQARRPHTHVRETFFDHARTHARIRLAVPPEQALARSRELLGQRHFRVIEDPKGGGRNLYADRNRFAPLGTVVAHAAFVVILFGVLVTNSFGYTDSGFNVPIGQRVEIGHDTGLSVEALAFTDVYNPDGTPQDYASELVLYRDGAPVAEKTIRVNSPLTHDGVTINQASFGIAADLRVAGPDGAQLPTLSVPLQWQTPDARHTYGSIELPDQGLEVYVVTAASGQVDSDIAPGQAELEIYRLGEDVPVDQRIIDQNTPAELAGLTFTFDRERRYTGLIVSQDPGEPWVWTGCLLLVLGTCWTMFLRHRRIWVRVHPTTDGGSEIRLASPDRPDSGFQRQFHAVVTALADTPSPVPAGASPTEGVSRAPGSAGTTDPTATSDPTEVDRHA